MSSLPPSTIELSLESKEEIFNRLVKEIVLSCTDLLATRVHISIVHAVGNFLYIDPVFDEYLIFIKKYIEDNFKHLTVGECAIPFGGMNLGFFKISEKAIVVVYLASGPSAQLFALKTQINKWTTKIDSIFEKLDLSDNAPEIQEGAYEEKKPVPFLPSAQPVKEKRKDLKRVPLLIKPLTGKEKLPLEDVKILQYCDGTYSIDEICNATLYAILRVNMVIRKYEKKNWLKVLRVV